jgi:hypothetical protein
MPEAASEDTRPHPHETAALRRRARLPAGAFSVIPRYLVDNAGRANIGDVLDSLASIATVLRLAFDHAGEEATLSGDERDGLSFFTTLLRTSFYDLDTMFEQYEEDRGKSVECLEQHCGELERRIKSKDALIATLRTELGEADHAPRRRSDAPAASAPAPDLTEPADPPRAANG